MRLEEKAIVKDHDLLLGVGEDDHHNRGTSATILVNSQAISGTSSYDLRISLGKTGYSTMRACLRGKNNVDIQGHDGVFVLASDTSEDCSAIGLRPYGGGGYVTSYMGGYSRIHGDSNLSPIGMFGQNISLRDAYIDDDDAVFEFYNSHASSQNLTVYGTLVAK
jgi:hypothetical protein